MTRRATIADIAREAKVSISTVSYVLNDVKSVRPETRKRIVQAVKRLHYQPRMVARGLKTKQSLTIGAIVTQISNSFFAEIVHGIEDTAYRNNFSVILCDTNEDAEKERRYLGTLISKDIDGLVFISTGQNPHLLDRIDDKPIVIVDRKITHKASRVLVDNVEGGHLATRLLLSRRGYPIHILCGPVNISTYRDRLSGYIRALGEGGINFEPTLVHHCGVDIESGYKTMKNLIAARSTVSSVFATNDLLAIGAMKAMSESGIEVGKEVCLVGYDDIIMAAMVSPALTTVRQPKYEMGAIAAGLLIEQITTKTRIRKEIILKPELIIRDTAK